MPSLQNILNTPGFKIGIELVSTRGTLEQEKTKKIINFGEQLTQQSTINWISITENAGGHPAISPSIIGKSLLNKGKEIIIHLTCKDLNRNGLESRAWELSSEGFQNILTITGDYPISGIKGTPKPVFDIDSVGLIYTLNQLNKGLKISSKKNAAYKKTHFYLGAVTSNYKKHENELIPQYIKLLKKIEIGASFIINQVGFDASKMAELIRFQKYKNLNHIHFIGNVFLLSKFTVSLFHKNTIPGVVLTDQLYELCQKNIQSPDKGKRFFIELAAKMLAIYKGLGYKGGYLGGVHTIKDYQAIMESFHSFAKEDWKQFAKELQFSQKDEFFMFQKDKSTGLVSQNINKTLFNKGKKKTNLHYAFSKQFHRLLFTKDKGLYNFGKQICEKSNTSKNAPKWMYQLEKIGKKMLFGCRDCGDCSLHEIGYLCPESQCAKNQRNGPCGGSLHARCEVKDVQCIWARAYDQTKYEKDIWKLLEHAPTFQNHQLENTSSWGNYWLEKDHCSTKN